MDSIGKLADETDYIFDSDGRRKVVDGKEYPITEEEHRKENPYHKDVGCTECSFVQDKETLFLWLVPRELKDKATNKPLFVGKFTMPEWIDHRGFYLFRCRSCNQICVDYPHGYTPIEGLMFLCCHHCKEKLPLEVTEEKAIYEREGVVAPLTAWQELKASWKARRELKKLRRTAAEIGEQHGVKIMINGVATHVSTKSRMNIWGIGLGLLALWMLGIVLARILNLHPF